MLSLSLRRTVTVAAAATLLLGASPFAIAATAATAYAFDASCFKTAAAHYEVDETLLRAIAKIESNYRPDAIHFDADGTHDVGVMQINSSHLKRLRPYGIDEQTLLSNPCTNIAVGASILRGFVTQFGLTWRAVGSYGAGTSPNKEAARIAYAALVSRALIPDARPGGARAPTSIHTASAGLFASVGTVARPAPRMLVLE